MFLTNTQQEILKYLAIIFMFLDHLYIFYPEIPINLRYIGRLAFPIFAFLIVYNYLFNTSNKEKYITKIFLWSLITQPIYCYSFEGFYIGFNILFTLLLGMLIIYFYENRNHIMILLLLLLILNFYNSISFSYWGILLILAFYISLKYKLKIGVFLQGFILLFLNSIYFSFYTLLFLPLIIFISNLEIPKKLEIKKRINGIYFYLFYPLHMLILKLITISY